MPSSATPRSLHSFPTRRSSDLVGSDHVGDRAPDGGPTPVRRRHRRRDVGECLPLRHVRPHPRRHPRRGADAGRVSMLTRRRFVQSTALAGAALLVGFRLDGRLAVADDVFAPNAFVRIASDNTVTIIGKHLEMGQGTYTGLAVILAEELDADWSQMRVEAAPADATRYNNLRWGPVQGTGGSTGLANSWGQLRRAGATARALLVEPAGRDWR